MTINHDGRRIPGGVSRGKVAHSPVEGRPHLLREHLRCVRDLAGAFGEPLGLRSEARLAGLLHDLGKYGQRFQARLRGEVHGIDHWSAGAWIAVVSHRAPAVAWAIHAHHIGLQAFDADALRALEPARLATHHSRGLTLSDPDPARFVEQLRADGLEPETPGAGSALGHVGDRPGTQLDLRLLFSCLVDADFLDTAAHFEGDAQGKRARQAGPTLDAARALAVLERHVAALEQASHADERVRGLRADLWQACLDAGARPERLWTLTAPTGAGKTLAMVGFALRQALTHGLRRIVVVIPYLSIIEQTVAVLRAIFEPTFGPHFVLEHHSLARVGDRAWRDDEEEDERRRRLLAENWDAPLIVTTSVQALESLFANRPAACRKLHRLAGSILLFDEVQTLPLDLIVPTLAALSHLTERHGSRVVFATATQPAFSALDPAVRELERRSWAPREVVPVEARLFERLRRTRVRWPRPGARATWDTLANELSCVQQALCIVNLRRHAVDLIEALRARLGPEALFHLSTSLCPTHRREMLDRVRQRLARGATCRLVSTQCVEAGVDIDFPAVWRAMAPLDAIAQAAGRCNREGRLDAGVMTVFEPQDDGHAYPTPAYEAAARLTRVLLERAGTDGLDLDDPASFTRYYEELFDLRGLAATGKLSEAIRARDFPTIAKLYRLIPEDRVNVLVPYEPRRYDELLEQAHARGANAAWFRDAQAHAVSVFRKGRPEDDPDLAPVPLAGRVSSDEWFYLARAARYDRLLGLRPPERGGFWIG